MTLPDTLAHNPIISTWLRFEHNEVLLCTGKVELGQGVMTALAMVAAEELDVSPARIRVQTGRTDDGPREFPTVGSLSMLMSSPAVRAVAAEARHRLLAMAAERFGVDPATLTVDDGVIINPAGNEQVSYWTLLAGTQLDVAATGDAPLKPAQQYRLVGQSMTRIDLRAKISGKQAFIQDLEMAGLRHARVIRPAHYEQAIDTLDTSKAEQVDGFYQLVRDGNFLAVVAASAEAAAKAAEQVRVRWLPTAPIRTDTEEFLREEVTHRLLVEDGTPSLKEIPGADIRPGEGFRASYFKPYHLHAAMAPSAALAQFRDDHLTIYSHTQGPAQIRLAIAEVLGLDRSQVTVIHRENAGCYGHNGADDAAMDAALIAMHCPGTPVLLQWSRMDEHRHEPMSPAMVVDIAAKLSGGRISHWQADVFSQVHSNRPFPAADGSTTFLAALQKQSPGKKRQPQPAMAPHAGIHRNADPYYDLAHKRITKNLVADTHIRTSSTRGLGAFANVFAIESFMDELADSAGIDPVLFRRSHLSDRRAIRVIESASDALNARTPVPERPWLVGRGIAFARYKNTQCYAAVAVLLEVNEETLAIRLRHAVIAADAGQVVDRDGISNQLEGGFIQAASWTLKEAVPLAETGSLAADWESYPILRFTEIPTVETLLLDHPEAPALGAGEATAGPTPAAIANAVCNATGLRIRQLPITPDALQRAALQQD